MQYPPDECPVYYYIIDPYEIHYLRFIVEAYEGLGVVSTIDSRLGLVKIAVAPGCEADLALVLESEREALKLREASPVAGGATSCRD